MLFSIIVTAYNIEEWITKCVESILLQTFKDYELILVDDGSTDQSGTICDNFACCHKNIRVIHKENGGVSDARNCGVNNAVGEYLIFVDGDDYIAKWALEEFYEIIREKEPDIILSEGTYHVSKEQSTLFKYYKREEFSGLTGEGALSRIIKTRNNWSTWGKCYRAGFWRSHHFKFQVGRLAEDFELIYKVIIEAKSVYMVSAFYYYQVRNDSIMHTIDCKIITDMVQNFGDWEEYLASSEINTALKEQLYCAFAHELCHLVLGYMYLLDKLSREKLIQMVTHYLYFLRYNRSSECRMVRLSIKLLGVKRTCDLLGIVKKYRLGR